MVWLPVLLPKLRDRGGLDREAAPEAGLYMGVVDKMLVLADRDPTSKYYVPESEWQPR